MTTTSRKLKENVPKSYTVRNIYQCYPTDKEKTLYLSKLANGIAQIITANQQKKSSGSLGNYK